jgi:uncharacterized SAM-binding protein YcdF (DUF218 family)
MPLLLLALLGAWWLPRRRLRGWITVLCSLVALWLMGTTVVGNGLIQGLTSPPAPIDSAQLARLSHAPHTAIVVLGAGLKRLAPEYGSADLRPLGNERLRYGVWLARQTGLPMVFSGGIAHGRDSGPTEADTARRLAQRDYGYTVRWLETQSRDTNENALYSVRLLHEEGIDRIVLVTHGFHQRRALAAFQRAIDRAGLQMTLQPAPLGLRVPGPLTPGDFIPNAEGFATTRLALHEWLGRLAGA